MANNRRSLSFYVWNCHRCSRLHGYARQRCSIGSFSAITGLLVLWRLRAAYNAYLCTIDVHTRSIILLSDVNHYASPKHALDQCQPAIRRTCLVLLRISSRRPSPTLTLQSLFLTTAIIGSRRRDLICSVNSVDGLSVTKYSPQNLFV